MNGFELECPVGNFYELKLKKQNCERINSKL